MKARIIFLVNSDGSKTKIHGRWICSCNRINYFDLDKKKIIECVGCGKRYTVKKSKKGEYDVRRITKGRGKKTA